MGTQSRIMKFFKFFTSVGILSIVGGIAADGRGGHGGGGGGGGGGGHGGHGGGGCGGGGGGHGGHGGPPWLPYNTSCICPDMCVYTGFSPIGRGICVNMETVLVQKLTKLANLNAGSPPDLCPQDYQGNQECCRCLKNRCVQSDECYELGGICRRGNGDHGKDYPHGILKKGLCKGRKRGCECYAVKPSSYPSTYNP